MENLHLMLIETLQLLGSDYNAQVRSFPNYVDVPDEIGLIFNDIFLLSDQLLKSKEINEGIFNRINLLNEFLTDYGNEEKFWTLEAMEYSKKWEHLRKQAKEIVSLMNVGLRPPKLFWLNYSSSKS